MKKLLLPRTINCSSIFNDWYCGCRIPWRWLLILYLNVVFTSHVSAICSSLHMAQMTTHEVKTVTCSDVLTHFRSSRWQIFFKICVIKNFANSKGKHLCWSLCLIKLQVSRPAFLSKRDSNTGTFLWNLQNLLENLFLKNTSSDCFCQLQPIFDFYNLCRPVEMNSCLVVGGRIQCTRGKSSRFLSHSATRVTTRSFTFWW